MIHDLALFWISSKETMMIAIVMIQSFHNSKKIIQSESTVNDCSSALLLELCFQNVTPFTTEMRKLSSSEFPIVC